MATFQRNFPAFRERGSVHGLEFTLIRKDGTTFPVLVNATAARDADGRYVRSLSTMVDMSERERAERALRKSEQRYRSLFEDNHAVMLLINPESRAIADANPAACAWYGWSREEMLAMRIDQINTLSSAAVRAEMESARAKRRGVFSFKHRRADGTIRDVEVYSGPIELQGKTLLYSVVHDITARKQAEAEIQRLNAELAERVVSRTAQLTAVTKELEAFAYSASHDLRAPLRVIDGFSAMVLEDAGGVLGPEDVRHLQRVREAAQRMSRLIDDLLGLSRLARRELIRERVDVSALARKVADELRSEHEARVVELVIAPDMAADADPRLLRVILRNLLDNAWKFTAKHEAARAEVGVTDADGERAFFVRDDGAGFDPEHAEHLFGAFQRLHTAVEFEGDGIGLAMVQRLVNRHGGRAWAEGQVEKGATFFFTLPREK
jgi:PAS domain S-box-containing protein